MKDKCYVFDFAPDRTLKMVAEAGQLSCKPGSVESRTKMGDLLNFCPVISVDGSRMIPYNVDTMLRTLKRLMLIELFKMDLMIQEFIMINY